MEKILDLIFEDFDISYSLQSRIGLMIIPKKYMDMVMIQVREQEQRTGFILQQNTTNNKSINPITVQIMWYRLKEGTDDTIQITLKPIKS